MVAPRLEVVIPARLLIGLGTGAGFIAGADYIRSIASSPTLQGLYGGVTLAGAGLAVAVVPPLVDPVGWRAPFLSAPGFLASTGR